MVRRACAGIRARRLVPVTGAALPPAVPGDAMVLAAGLGRRMLPLTEQLPKPLVKVAGRTLLDRALDVLVSAGVGRAVVNLHYLGDHVERHLHDQPPALAVRFADERAQLLETGGGIANALPLLESDPFLALNADNLWAGDSPVAPLVDAWDGSRMDALLLLVPRANAQCHDGPGDFNLLPSGQLARRGDAATADYVYTGLQMLSKRLFEDVWVEPFSMNRLWDRAAAAGRLCGVPFHGQWFDVGTAAAVPMVEQILGHR